MDTLEIALHELLDVVDFVFLVEATRSHKGVSWSDQEKRNFMFNFKRMYFGCIVIPCILNLFHFENCCNSGFMQNEIFLLELKIIDNFQMHFIMGMGQ